MLEYYKDGQNMKNVGTKGRMTNTRQKFTQYASHSLLIPLVINPYGIFEEFHMVSNTSTKKVPIFLVQIPSKE